MKIEIKTQDNRYFRTDTGPVRLKDLADSLQDELPYEILCARVNHHTRRLTEVVDQDCTVELLDLRSNEANMIYQASLTMLFTHAVHRVMGKDTKVAVQNSLSKGLYVTIKGSMSEELCRQVAQCMQDLVKREVPFVECEASREDLLAWARQAGRMDQVRLLQSCPDLQQARRFQLEDEADIYYEELLPDTSYLKYFEVRRYKNGVLLRFPHPSDPSVIPPFEEQHILYSAFSEETRWERLMNVETAADLNEVVQKKEDCRELVLLSEALHEKKIAELAQEIHDQKKRIILIAGPSSSGKTTFAKRLCIQLRVTGLKPLYLGTDDFFLERKDTPLLPNGKPDFESLRALDRDLFNRQMNDLLAGKKVDLPVFDFVKGEKVFGTRITSVAAGQPLVIEGLHCLNPQLTSQIPDDVKFKIYISPLTQLNIDAHNRIPTTDARMLRRLVRDAQFRGRSARTTISSWKEVREGEDAYIFPFSEEADAFFNSTCLYELAVLKKYARPQLEAITDDCREYAEAQRMLRFLAFFQTMDDEGAIPNNSILREFIGGSVIVQ
jgi:uridine kinase